MKQALVLLRAQCMAEAGFPQLLQVATANAGREEDIVDGLRLSAASFGPVDEDAARRDGLRSQPEPQLLKVLSFDSSFDAEDQRCSAQAQERLGPDAQEVDDRFIEMLNEVNGRQYATFASPEFREVRRQQLDCLVGLGFAPSDEDAYLREGREDVFGFEFGEEVVGTPGDAPTNEPGTVQILQPPRDVRYVPTPGEVEFALADLRCRRSTGFDEAFLEEARRVQTEIVDDLEPQLIDLTEDLDQLARAAADEVAD